MDKEIKEYIDKLVPEVVKEQLSKIEDIRKENTAKSSKYKNEIRKLILANSDNAKSAYGIIYKKYIDDTGDNIYASAKEKGLSVIDYVCQHGDIKNLYGIALCEFGNNTLPSEEELLNTLEDNPND